MRLSRLDEKKLSDIYQNMLNEDMDVGGVYGDMAGEYGNTIENQDFYANGDSRIPKILGVQTRKGKLKTTKKKKKLKKK